MRGFRRLQMKEEPVNGLLTYLLLKIVLTGTIFCYFTGHLQQTSHCPSVLFLTFGATLWFDAMALEKLSDNVYKRNILGQEETITYTDYIPFSI